MADITRIDQVATELDYLKAAWVNAANRKMSELDRAIAYANQQISDLKSQLSQAFQCKVVSGLIISVAGGSLKIGSSVVAIAPQQITLPASRTSIISISLLGVITVTATRPDSGLEIAIAATSATAITSLQNYPIFEARTAQISLDNYATIDYANSRSWSSVALARKSAEYAIPGRDTYYKIPFETLSGNGFSTNGDFTAAIAGKYIFQTSVRVDTLSPSTPMAAKLSLFSNSQEIAIIQQGDSAYGDITLNGSNVEPLTMAKDQKANLSIYLTRGTQSRVRETYTAVQVWRIP